MSREPHPSFYGFGQPDSLKERQEYTRLASAELEFEIPWIIDKMDNTMQKTYGGMPNMEFVIGPDGTLLASWDWANPNELKKFLEEKVGPSGILDEEWKALSQRSGMRTSMQNNDEVPATQVPRETLFPLKIELIAGDDEEKAPLTLEAGTLPPEVTPGGQSRLYLTIRPDAESGVHFDSAEAAIILLSDVKGIELKKDKVVAGKRQKTKDVFPHSLGVMWSRDKDSKDMEFTATVVAKMAKGEEPSREWTTKFRVSGPVPVVGQTTDEILASQLPPPSQLKTLQCVTSEEEKEAPFNIEARFHRDPANPGQGTLYLFLKVNADDGFKWNNLASPPQVAIKPISKIKLEKDILNAGIREGEDDVEDRILALRLTLESDAEEIALDLNTETWICNSVQGWCRQFAVSHKVTGKL